MLCACINAQRHVLLRFTGGDSKLNREWRSTLHHGFSSLEQMPRLCRRARHQGLTAHVQNKYFQSISFADTRRFRLHGPKAGLTSFANVGRGLVPATPLLPLRAFNHRPQSVELGCTSHGAYIFPTNVAPLERGALRLVNKGSFKPLPFRQGLLTAVSPKRKGTPVPYGEVSPIWVRRTKSRTAQWQAVPAERCRAPEEQSSHRTLQVQEQHSPRQRER